MFPPCAANACGNWLMMSSMRTLPVAPISSLVIAVTGLMLSRFGETIREPVIVNSSG